MVGVVGSGIGGVIAFEASGIDDEVDADEQADAVDGGSDASMLSGVGSGALTT